MVEVRTMLACQPQSKEIQVLAAAETRPQAIKQCRNAAKLLLYNKHLADRDLRAVWCGTNM